MSGDRGPTGRPQLEDLVQRARSGLRDWTDANESDPGVALLELFAFVGELLGSHAEQVASEAHLGSSRERGSTLELGDGLQGRRPPAGTPVGAAYRHGGGHAGVLQQQGRVVLDSDVSEEPTPVVGGVHRATVLDDSDPLGRHRLLVQVPDVGGDGSVWAAACFAASAASAASAALGGHAVPAVGAAVWVAFESGDPARPVWLGERVAG